MKLLSLRVKDYRGFQDAELLLEPDVTVLVGINGAGKTGLLEAAAILLTRLSPKSTTLPAESHWFQESDIRVGALKATIHLRLSLGRLKEEDWSTTIQGGATSFGRMRPSDPAEQDPLAQENHRELVVSYPTNRNALGISVRNRGASLSVRPESPMEGALDRGERNFRSFFEWFREEEDLENQLLRQSFDEGKPPPDFTRLKVVRQAIMRFVPGVSALRIERQPQRMILIRHGVRLDVAQLSDGEKCLLALVGDLARRMVLVAPNSEQPLDCPAVVLIDEIDLHLHPGLQRQILPRLREVFPQTQFIVSTHSPQVLASVHARSIRLIEDFQIRGVERETWRRDTNRILDSVFGDPGRPPEVARRLNELRDRFDEGDFAAARALIDQLHQMLEGDDPDVFFYENMLPPEGYSTKTSPGEGEGEQG